MYETTKSAAKNRLRFEKSPYLLQHAENPLDWHPRGGEAFRRARGRRIHPSYSASAAAPGAIMAHASFEDRPGQRLYGRHCRQRRLARWILALKGGTLADNHTVHLQRVFGDKLPPRRNPWIDKRLGFQRLSGRSEERRVGKEC